MVKPSTTICKTSMWAYSSTKPWQARMSRLRRVPTLSEMTWKRVPRNLIPVILWQISQAHFLTSLETSTSLWISLYGGGLWKQLNFRISNLMSFSICRSTPIGLFLCRGWALHIVDRWRDAVSFGSSTVSQMALICFLATLSLISFLLYLSRFWCANTIFFD